MQPSVESHGMQRDSQRLIISDHGFSFFGELMEFFYAAGACSLASHIALEEAGLEFEAKRVDLFKGEQQEASFL